MRIETFRAARSRHALEAVRDLLGDDAVVLRTRRVGDEVRVQATTTWELDAFQRKLRPAPLAGPRFGRPFRMVALVGPTGSGKTTTLAKLALGERAFGGGNVGVISLDTFRIGAVEQIQTYADLADFPLEVLSDVAEVPGALKRLKGCDTVLVDTPGRGPRESADEMSWRRILKLLRPEEVHLVLPAGLRAEVAAGLRQFYAPLAPTHLLLTKLDEVPWEEGVAELADGVGLPTRWVSDGQDVPADLHEAAGRLMRSLSHDRGPWLPARVEAS
ncbi:flagellar biosynthesis protein FlhF [Gaopeijia maritima]|uniref:Flagellar biosynthesis protein FlhF n=1 Tax=Gaopeijia maritima TaxID=3119007 RepID=A0ABU9ECQ2_9BACT